MYCKPYPVDEVLMGEKEEKCAGLAEIELIFTTVAGMGLCFVFVLETVLIHEMFLLLQSRAQPGLLLTPHARQEDGGSEGAWKGHAQDTEPH